MQVHNLKPKQKKRDKKRIARGGKRGTYSGKGLKGQKSRAGRKIRPQLREIINKFPKQRGSTFKDLKHQVKEIQLSELQKKFPNGGKISPALLRKAGLIAKSSFPKGKIKILGTADLNAVYEISGCVLSRKAQEAVIKAGGKITK